MSKEKLSLLSGEVVDEDVEISLAELCNICRIPAERVFEFVEEGILDPLGRTPSRWRFRRVSVHRVRCVLHLESDLGINVAGAALALELLEEIETMRSRLKRLEEL
jgi:chaperone modulatory protein CbpM